MMVNVQIRNTWATSEAEFMKNSSNTEVEFKKSVAYKKLVCISRPVETGGADGAAAPPPHPHPILDP